MFLQIALPERDRAFHKFVWKDSKSGEIRHFQFKVHCFGNRASPAVSIFAIKHHAEKYRDLYPRAAETVLESTIVDDNCDSVESPEEALQLINDLKKLYASAGMDIRKWASNSKEVLDNVPKADQAADMAFSYEFEPGSDLPKIKALGVIWLAASDSFTFLAEFNLNQIWTKRTILSTYSKLFDPMGFISPVAITARIVTQACWRHDVGWDDPLPEKVLNVWQKWVDALKDLPKIRLKRCLRPLTGTVTEEEVHIFCDGSTQAYGAVAYLKSILDDGSVYTNLIVSKARVAPIKVNTVNKLELRAAVTAITLSKFVQRVLKTPRSSIYFWTDSKNVLAWLHTKKWLTRFVTNRVTEIRSASDLEAWRWGPLPRNLPSLPAPILHTCCN